MPTHRPKPEAWHIVRDTETDGMICFHPSRQMSLAGNSRYVDVGRLTSEQDAELFIRCKALNLAPDAIEYLCCEHDISQTIDKTTDVNAEPLNEILTSIREESGRTCFGHCHSMEGCAACATCHKILYETWRLCAYLCAINATRPGLFD